mmetsp:Transcript_18570/g.40890  ORF Transcript_18570/g.40890 Transcript_18570/m.40890 type:complete len:595 (+) Transcript_18570:318-2102(+)
MRVASSVASVRRERGRRVLHVGGRGGPAAIPRVLVLLRPLLHGLLGHRLHRHVLIPVAGPSSVHLPRVGARVHRVLRERRLRGEGVALRAGVRRGGPAVRRGGLERRRLGLLVRGLEGRPGGLEGELLRHGDASRPDARDLSGVGHGHPDCRADDGRAEQHHHQSEQDPPGGEASGLRQVRGGSLHHVGEGQRRQAQGRLDHRDRLVERELGPWALGAVVLDVLARPDGGGGGRARLHGDPVVDEGPRHSGSCGVLDEATIHIGVLPVLAHEEGEARLPARVRAVLPVLEGRHIEDLCQVIDLHVHGVHQDPEAAMHDQLGTHRLQAVARVEAVLADQALPALRNPAGLVLQRPDAAERAVEASGLARLLGLELDLHQSLAPARPTRHGVLQDHGGLVPAGGREAVLLSRPALEVGGLLMARPGRARLVRGLAWEAGSRDGRAGRALLGADGRPRDDARGRRLLEDGLLAPQPAHLVRLEVGEVGAARRGLATGLTLHGAQRLEGHVGDILHGGGVREAEVHAAGGQRLVRRRITRREDRGHRAQQQGEESLAASGVRTHRGRSPRMRSLAPVSADEAKGPTVGPKWQGEAWAL